MGDVIGHGEVMDRLHRAATHGVLAHAYLFVGPRGVGKTTVARWMAQRLLCNEQGSGVRRGQGSERVSPPCGTCAVCVQVERGVHPDVGVVQPEDGALRVEPVRAWAEMLQCSSLLGGWKIGIVEEGSLITEEAANALLKLLEEPPRQTMLLMTAQSARGVLPTIASRCAVLQFHRVPALVIAAALGARGIADDDARAIGALADGCPGRALQYATDADARDAACARMVQAQECVGAPVTKRLQLVERVARGWAKEKDLVRERADVRVWIAAMTAVARAQTRRTPNGNALGWSSTLARAPRDLDANVAPRLVLEAMVIAAPL